MKMKWCVTGFLLLVLCAGFQLQAQQTNADSKLFEETKAKAENGDAKAEFDLSTHYMKDAASFEEGSKWLRKSAENGFPEAQRLLGAACEVVSNYDGAYEWYGKSANQGDANAQFYLGNLYYFGQGVAKDYVEAYKWWNLAGAHGQSEAIGNREQLGKLMTSEQIAEAQQLAREFKPRKEGANNSTSSDNPRATGTGFFITEDGYLISNYHVVKDAAKVRLLTGAGLIDAKVMQVDAANDLALLKADGRFACLPIVPSRTAALGGTVATVGFPDIGLQGFAPKLAKGEIASLSGAGDDPRYFQISAPVQPGNSGGALVDARGNVIGIVSAKLDASTALAMSGSLPENVNYAVKSSLLLSFLESVPDLANKLKAPVTADRKFEDVVKSAQDAAVLVLVY